MQFKLGDKVKIGKGTCTYIITGVYLKEYRSDNKEFKLTQVGTGGVYQYNKTNGNSYYHNADQLKLVREIKAYAFENKNGMAWFSSDKPKKGFKRVPEFDFSKDI